MSEVRGEKAIGAGGFGGKLFEGGQRIVALEQDRLRPRSAQQVREQHPALFADR